MALSWCLKRLHYSHMRRGPTRDCIRTRRTLWLSLRDLGHKKRIRAVACDIRCFSWRNIVCVSQSQPTIYALTNLQICLITLEDRQLATHLHLVSDYHRSRVSLAELDSALELPLKVLLVVQFTELVCSLAIFIQVLAKIASMMEKEMSKWIDVWLYAELYTTKYR